MTAAALLVAASVLLGAAALRATTAAGSGGPGRLESPVPGRLERLGARLATTMPDAGSRIARAGGAGGLTGAGLAALRVLGAACGGGVGLVLLGTLPGRLGPIAALLAVAGGAGLPDLWLERAARRRQREMLAALPDAIEVLAVGSGGGRSIASGVRELAAAGRGPLARELGAAAAEIECGRPARSALAALRERTGGPELRSLTVALERSARLGSPLVDDLQRQASSLRDARRRRMAELASRAAPKMQLVIALLLVPSVLLMIAAALFANAGALLGGIA